MTEDDFNSFSYAKHPESDLICISLLRERSIFSADRVLRRVSMSHSEERSPKRQRRSYSPASPPVSLETKTAAAQQQQAQALPQTPPPSVHMSPSWQSQSALSSTPGVTTIASSPDTSGLVGHRAADKAVIGSEQETQGDLMTPASGLDRSQDDQDDGSRDVEMNTTGEHISPSDSTAHRRTDHERDSSQGQTETPKLYLLHTKPIAPSRPHASQNMISLYSLEQIQNSVARRDANGNKINKLRKSYENKVKALGLEGRSKAEVGSLALQGLLDPGWDMDIGNGTTAWQARSAEFPLNQQNSDALFARLGTALVLAPGHLPKAEHENWKGVLGLDDTIAAAARPAAAAGGGPRAALSSPNPLANRLGPTTFLRDSTPNSPRNVHRPERANKKRRYDESSYAGYQEGYDDDGYDTGGGDDTGSRGSGVKRQKRKDFAVASSSQGPFSNNTAGMVGVRTT